MSGNRASSQQGVLNSPQPREEEINVELNNEQRNVTPSKLMKTIQILKDELQSYKDDNIRDRQEHQEVNAILLQTSIELNKINNMFMGQVTR